MTKTKVLHKIHFVRQTFFKEPSDSILGHYYNLLGIQLEGVKYDEPNQMQLDQVYKDTCNIEKALHYLRKVKPIFG